MSAHDATATNGTITHVAVVGAGQMGNGIAHVFATSGYAVTMIDVSAAGILATGAGLSDRQVKCTGNVPIDVRGHGHLAWC